MRASYVLFFAGCLAAVAGCRSTSEMLDGRQPDAMLHALDKGRYLLSCPETAEALISRRVASPAPEGGWMSGLQRAEFTIDVAGCGRQLTFIVVCPFPGGDCLALVPGPFNTWQRNY